MDAAGRDARAEPEPVELPDPSDSEESYWLARTVWALGEGYAAFVPRPAFAAFLRDRMDLSLAALERQVLDHTAYRGGRRRPAPAWLIVDGADASAEAVLGLAAFVDAGRRSPRARTALRQLAEGIAEMSGGDARQWPYGGDPAVDAPAVVLARLGLADAGRARRAPRPPSAPGRPAPAAAATTPRSSPRTCSPRPGRSTAGCPCPGTAPRSPTAWTPGCSRWSRWPTRPTGRRWTPRRPHRGLVLRGQPRRRADVTTRRPGAPYDGLSADGVVNRNSGAESTIHGLLRCSPSTPARGGALARRAVIRERDGTRHEAEPGTPDGGATGAPPRGIPWTGESQFSNSAYALMPAGASIRWPVPAAAPAPAGAAGRRPAARQRRGHPLDAAAGRVLGTGPARADRPAARVPGARGAAAGDPDRGEGCRPAATELVATATGGDGRGSTRSWSSRWCRGT